MNIEEYYDKIYRYCFYKLQDKCLAEDVTQETFLRFLKKENEGIIKEENYLYTIAKNLCNDEIKKIRRERDCLVSQYEVTESSDINIENMVVNQVYVQEVLSGLTENDMEILLLKYINNESINDISRIMGISRFALYRRIRRIEKQLKMSIGRTEDE
ncbi:MAG: sigma-70 family RNA polymerase sigma factor [Eubacterium sp.]|nr:sigma-70 family RNA polymerase sigma factor [Eubacterium sp.]